MLQQPSEFMMYRKLPLDLNRHTLDLSSYDFNDIGLLQAQRAAAHALFSDACTTAGPTPSRKLPLDLNRHDFNDIRLLPAQRAAATTTGLTPSWKLPLDHNRHDFNDIRLLQAQRAAAHALFSDACTTTGPTPSPLDLNKHDFNDIRLLQAQRAAAHALFSDACTTTGPTPSPKYWGIHGMYDPILQHHHHQQQQQQHQYFDPMAAAGFWKQQARNCWFPNWQELFQLVAQEGQQKHAIAAGFQQQQQQGGVAGAQQPHPGVPLPSSGAQSLPPAGSKVPHAAAQPLHPGAQSLYSAIQPPHPAVQSSHIEEKKSEDTRISCCDLKGPSFPTLGPVYKYTIESPPWLPQGWITEIQTRRTGTTAGTRDKYFKDLVSGRRFRSRNEVLHFLETGKGRVRKRRKRKKAIAFSSAGHATMNSFAHKTHTLEAVKPFPCLPACQPVGFLLHPAHVGFSLPPVPVAEEMPRGLKPPCQPPTAFSAISSQPAIMIGQKRPAQERVLPVKKKAKIESPKKCQDKQASRLWQWLKKPVARNDEQPEVHKLNAIAPSFEKKSSEMADQRTVEELSREIQASQRTVQLGREIQEAQRTVMQLGREMQATVEKLGREIQAGQRDVKLEIDENWCRGVQADQRDVALSSETQAVQKSVKSSREMLAAQRTDGAMGNATQAAERPVVAMGNAIQAAQRIDGAMCNETQAAQGSVVAMGNVIQASQRPDVAMGIVPRAAEWPVVAMVSVIQAAPRPDVAMGNVTQAAQRPDVTAMGNVTQAAQMPVVAMGHVVQASQMPVVAMGHVIQASHMPVAIAMGNAVQRAGAMINVAQTAPLNVVNLSIAAQRAVEVNKQQMVEAKHRHRDKKFSVLNPKLDLSRLNPSLTSRQRAKVVQRMKARHAKELLAILGRQLCYKALRKHHYKHGLNV